MKALAIFLISLLAFQTVMFRTSIVTEARPLLPIMENPKNAFVKNIYNSPEVSRPLPSPPPPPRPAPPPKPPTFKFIQDLQLFKNLFPSSNLILMFTTLSTATETKPFELILENPKNSFAKNTYYSPEAFQRIPPPPPAPAAEDAAFKFIQDLLQLSGEFSSNQILFTASTVKDARSFGLILESSGNGNRFVKMNPMDVERRSGPSPPSPTHNTPIIPVSKHKSPPNPDDELQQFAFA